MLFAAPRLGRSMACAEARAMSKVSRHIVLPPGGKDPAMLLEFRCPQASKPIHVEVSGNPHLVKDNWTREIRVRCPHCRAVHWFPYRQGYIEAAISQLNKAPAARDA